MFSGKCKLLGVNKDMSLLDDMIDIVGTDNAFKIASSANIMVIALSMLMI